MARYLLKQMSKTTYKIDLNRKKVGGVIEREAGWVAAINGHRSEPRSTPQAAFTAAVQIVNRIALCGENDQQKAIEVLEARNEKVRLEAEEANRLCGFRAWKVRNRKTTI